MTSIRDAKYFLSPNTEMASIKEFIAIPEITKTILAEIKDHVSKSIIRILADVGLETFNQADFNIEQIDRVYHLRDYSWTSKKQQPNIVYELMVRMQRINQKPVYIEMIINFKDTINGKEAIMFITEDVFLFTQTFLTGNKQLINGFIMIDEGLSLSPSSLILDENLNLKCAKKVIDQFITN
ncbi:hypothetical protein TCON_2724, partial [Astathelohania contejeani]